MLHGSEYISLTSKQDLLNSSICLSCSLDLKSLFLSIWNHLNVRPANRTEAVSTATKNSVSTISVVAGAVTVHEPADDEPEDVVCPELELWPEADNKEPVPLPTRSIPGSLRVLIPDEPFSAYAPCATHRDTTSAAITRIVLPLFRFIFQPLILKYRNKFMVNPIVAQRFP